MITTGHLNITGKELKNSRTRLTKSAYPGDSNIFVTSTAGWKTGDEIVLTTSTKKFNLHDKVKISNVVSATEIAL